MSNEAQHQLLREKIKAAEDKAATWEQHWRRALEKYNAAELAFIEAREALHKVNAAIISESDTQTVRGMLFDAIRKADLHTMNERKPI